MLESNVSHFAVVALLLIAVPKRAGRTTEIVELACVGADGLQHSASPLIPPSAPFSPEAGAKGKCARGIGTTNEALKWSVELRFFQRGDRCSLRFDHHGVFVLIGWRAGAQKDQVCRLSILNPMHGTGRDGNRIARPHRFLFALQMHGSRAR